MTIAAFSVVEVNVKVKNSTKSFKNFVVYKVE